MLVTKWCLTCAFVVYYTLGASLDFTVWRCIATVVSKINCTVLCWICRYKKVEPHERDGILAKQRRQVEMAAELEAQIAAKTREKQLEVHKLKMEDYEESRRLERERQGALCCPLSHSPLRAVIGCALECECTNALLHQ